MPAWSSPNRDTSLVLRVSSTLLCTYRADGRYGDVGEKSPLNFESMIERIVFKVVILKGMCHVTSALTNQ